MSQLSALDRLEIMQLQSIYGWGIDGRCEATEFPRAFAPDVEVVHSEFFRITGVDRLAAWMSAFHAPFDSTQHLISNHWIEADGDVVTHRSYVQVAIMKRGHPGGDLLSTGAYYQDRVVRTDVGWRIAARSLRNMWRGGNHDLIEMGKTAAAGQ